MRAEKKSYTGTTEQEKRKAARSRVEKKTARRNGIARLLFTLIAISLEIAIIVVFFVALNGRWSWASMCTRVVGFVIVLTIYAQHKTASMKMPWIILILLMPVLGIVMYLLIGLNGSTRKMRRRFDEIDGKLFKLLPVQPETDHSLSLYDKPLGNLSSYIENYSHYPLYRNTDVIYFSDAAEALEAQKAAMRSARHFIFLEYHAIEEKESWEEIEKILEIKAKENVEVRVFYDDMGSISFLSSDFRKRLKEKGISCRVFNPFMPGLNAFLNNRDHRKITVIDNRVAFTGGYNIANEYFNITHPYGHWKDTGIRLEGDAVRSFTVMFLEMWNAIKANDIDDSDYEKYLPEPEYRAKETDGYVQPYGDNPIDDENVGENVYISLAERAENYVWYMTPYLIITDEMIHALSLAAKRGVDVRIVTPGIPDKKMVYSVTRSYYNSLVRNGVRIFEYSPGFCHAKLSVSDDKAGVCGTINLDYRSLYHHFEDGCLIVGKKAVFNIRDDIAAAMAESREVTELYRTGRSRFLRLGQMFLRLFAELL
jgi:cardiolipin synthase